MGLKIIDGTPTALSEYLKEQDLKKEIEYHREFYNAIKGDEQWIRLSDGCFRSCWNCYCPKDKLSYDLPPILKNKVRFLDMNFLYAHKDPVEVLKELAKIKVNHKIVKYAFLCGLDFTLLNPRIIYLCKKARVGRFNNKGNWINGLTIAWDRSIDEKDKIINAVKLIKEAGYKKESIACFMLCNGKVSFKECMEKMKVLKDLKVQVQDCWYDNQKRGSIKPIYWTQEECDIFGKVCRSHNIAIIQKQYDSLDLLQGFQQASKNSISFEELDKNIKELNNRIINIAIEHRYSEYTNCQLIDEINEVVIKEWFQELKQNHPKECPECLHENVFGEVKKNHTCQQPIQISNSISFEDVLKIINNFDFEFYGIKNYDDEENYRGTSYNFEEIKKDLIKELKQNHSEKLYCPEAEGQRARDENEEPKEW